MRIDKFIWCVRLYKTRTKATKACKEGKIKCNDADVKPAQDCKKGDTIALRKRGVYFYYKVLSFPKRRVGAKLVEQFIVNITPQENIDRYKTIQLAQKQYREKGKGKPSKKERRALQQFLNQS